MFFINFANRYKEENESTGNEEREVVYRRRS